MTLLRRPEDVLKTSVSAGLETEFSTIDCIYGLLLLSRAPQDSIDKSFYVDYFFPGNVRTAKIS